MTRRSFLARIGAFFGLALVGLLWEPERTPPVAVLTRADSLRRLEEQAERWPLPIVGDVRRGDVMVIVQSGDGAYLRRMVASDVQPSAVYWG